MEAQGPWWFPDTNVFQSITCLGSGLPDGPRNSLCPPSSRSYTRGFSVSGVTLSLQTSFCFFPGKEIRKLPNDIWTLSILGLA